MQEIFRYPCTERFNLFDITGKKSKFEISFTRGKGINTSGNVGTVGTVYIGNKIKIPINHFRMRHYIVILYGGKDYEKMEGSIFAVSSVGTVGTVGTGYIRYKSRIPINQSRPFQMQHCIMV